MANLIEGLQAEMNRVREMELIYAELPGNVGAFAIAMIKIEIEKAEKAIAEGDTIMMMTALTELQKLEL
jgi:hypothetical protein